MALDLKLVPPQVLNRLLEDLESNREFDMGGYSVPTDKVFALFDEPIEANAN